MLHREVLKTEEAITLIKETFEQELKKCLELTKVSAPLIVFDGTGINDDLNGIERPLTFPIKALDEQKAVVVQSLAKWKRLRLKELGIETGKGLLTDMRALRPDEEYSVLHSIYVDQWDWEKHINTSERNLTYLKKTVIEIYRALRTTERIVHEHYTDLTPVLPTHITFIHAEELLQLYPLLTAKQRENAVAKEYGAVFIIGIGKELSNGKPHDGRAPDYDDWSSMNEEGFYGLNGDIILWNHELQCAFEVTSMGIRVDKEVLLKQLKEKVSLERIKLAFHSMLLSDQLPQSIGGGIGQSRVCMFMLKKLHIGEVQVGLWSDTIRKESFEKGICLL